jgi:hypothetical protein
MTTYASDVRVDGVGPRLAVHLLDLHELLQADCHKNRVRLVWATWALEVVIDVTADPACLVFTTSRAGSMRRVEHRLPRMDRCASEFSHAIAVDIRAQAEAWRPVPTSSVLPCGHSPFR